MTKGREKMHQMTQCFEQSRSLSVVPVVRFVGQSQPLTEVKGHRPWPVDLPKYDQPTQIISLRESWQLQYDKQWEQLFVTCETSVKA